jgi:hypothetical protein
LKYGGDDMTRVLTELLMRRSNFPYKNCRLGNTLDRMTMDRIKETVVTFNEVRFLVGFIRNH